MKWGKEGLQKPKLYFTCIIINLFAVQTFEITDMLILHVLSVMAYREEEGFSGIIIIII
jgi:hypothetical protein